MNNENNLYKHQPGIILKKKSLSKSDNLKRRLWNGVLNLVSINKRLIPTQNQQYFDRNKQ